MEVYILTPEDADRVRYLGIPMGDVLVARK